MISQSTQAIPDTFSQIDEQQITLVKFNEMSLESVHHCPSSGNEMKEINFSDHRKSDQGYHSSYFRIFQQILSDKQRSSIKKSQSNKANSKIDQEDFPLDNSKKSRQFHPQSHFHLTESKHHECVCIALQMESCDACFCLLQQSPCIPGVCCNKCCTLDRQSLTVPFQIQDGSQENHKNHNEYKQNQNQVEEKEFESPQKKKIIKKGSHSKDSKASSLGKNYKRKTIFRKIESQKQKKIESKDAAIYPILSHDSNEVIQIDSPTKSGKKKGLKEVTLNSSKIKQNIQSPLKQAKEKTKKEDYRCNCNQKKCIASNCGCNSQGKMCSQKCGCNTDCQNNDYWHKKIKISGPKVYLDGSGSGISSKSMQFTSFIYPESNQCMIQSKKSSQSRNGLNQSKNQCCSCEADKKCSQKTCQCFKGKRDCGPECKCLQSACRNRNTKNRIQKKSLI